MSKSVKIYAHSKTLRDGITPAPREQWEPLFTSFHAAAGSGCGQADCSECAELHPDHGHLNKVAWWAAKFAAEMFPAGPNRESARQWGFLAGLWHDLGKFSPEWQTYLTSKTDPNTTPPTGKLDHSTAGAQHSVKAHPVLGHVIGYPIAGHHSGLLDGTSNGSCQAARLQKADIPDFSNAPPEVTAVPVPSLPPFLKEDSFSLSFFIRLVFSSLVDADFLATEAFMGPERTDDRNRAPANVLTSLADLIDARIDAFPPPASEDIVNRQRRNVVEDCRQAAHLAPGIFSLTVPTGGGKTLSSLSFALRHAIASGQRRVIYVAPFTSIIEQNAEVIRDIIAPLVTEDFEPLIEHHSSLSPEKESVRSRLATENWDAPIIITTAVQFYESLFAAKTSRTRKLHNIANSVVILDEAQSLPVDFLRPCLRVLQELSDHYHTTTVLCTATQPAIHYDAKEFPIGLKDCREIIQDTDSLFAALKRVEVNSLGDLPDADLVERVASLPQVLCIVNRRKHAQKLFQSLGEADGNYHLSALMCPQHRSEILAEVRTRLTDGLPARVISTQLIEAGVDVDFPVVFRALAGLDSIAQAAGRCNRNGKLPTSGTTYIFRPEDQRGEAYFRETAQVAHQLIDLHPDLLGQEAIRHYFDLYYYQQSKRWDSKGILDDFRLDRNSPKLPFHFQFSEVAQKFRLIEDWQVPIIIPFDDKARELLDQLRNPAIPLHRQLFRALQRYTVQIPPRLRDENLGSIETLRDGDFHALVSVDLHYSQHFGLTFEKDHSSSQSLIVSS